jgi:hypothetical protein
VGDPRKVFLVHGRDCSAVQGMVEFLRSLGLDPIRWPDAQRATGKPGSTFSDILKRGFEMSGATVVLLTPDEETYLRTPLRKSTDTLDDTGPVGQPRPNVLYELGWAMHYDRDKTIAVRFGATRIPSDIYGRHLIWIEKESDQLRLRDELLQALEQAGCDVEKRADWISAGAKDLERAIAHQNPVGTHWVEAGLGIGGTRYRYSEVMDNDCEYVLMTGHNFGDQFGTRVDPEPRLYENIVRLLLSSDRARVHLVFAPPRLLRSVHPLGHKDLVEKSVPRMWDLMVDPRLKNVRNRLKIVSHKGAMFLTAFLRDPENPERALLITTPRWVSDAKGPGRPFVVLRRNERPDIFNAIWDIMYSDLRTNEGADLGEVVDELQGDLGAHYGLFVRGQLPKWRLPE